MPQEFDAIYEQGMFRPLQPVDLPEQTKVHLQMHDAGESKPPTLAADIVAQKAALKELLDWVHSQPIAPSDESVSARDHDRILYGWQK